MRRLRLVWVILGVIVVAAAYQLLLGDRSAEPRLFVPRATATIGSASEAIGVGPQGQVLAWLPLPVDFVLPYLPITEPPPSGQLAGPVLEQALVLGAAPAALRPHLNRSYYGENGVAVELRSGIELRFGDASQALLKWDAAAAVITDPSLEALDYVNLHAPRRPTVGGSGHTLPPVE